MKMKPIYLSCKNCALVEEVEDYVRALPYVNINRQRFLCKDCLKVYLQSKVINKKLRG